MLAITVELLHGTYRADPDGLAHTGGLDRGEWPPAPLRLLAALVAADGTRDLCRFTDGSELAFLEACDPPQIYASEPRRTEHQILQARYVVRHKPAGGPERNTHQEYPGRVGVQLRPGVRVAPASPTVAYVWDVEPPAGTVEALAARAARVGYLGTADSPVRVSVSTERPADLGAPYVPDSEGNLHVGVPQVGVIAAMDAHFDRWVEQGASVHRSQSPGLRRLATYRAPGEPAETVRPEPSVLWVRLERAVSGRRIGAVTEAFKAAVLDRYQRDNGEPPRVLHGHGFEQNGYDLARFLALPDVANPHSRGRIHGLALWLPPGTDAAVEERCRDSLRGLTVLVGSGFRVGCGAWAGESRPWAANPARWQGRARRWVTAFPALYERRVPELTLAEVGRWCVHAGLPQPVTFRSERVPLVPGAVDLHPREVNRPGLPARRYSHLELRFAEAVRGPIAVGAGRQRGLGLLVPLPGGEGDGR